MSIGTPSGRDRPSKGRRAGVIVLDTHAWLWWTAAPERLSAAATAAIERANGIGVPSICCWEIAMLELRGSIALDRPVAAWIRQALTVPGVRSLPLTPELAVQAALLEHEGFAGDPADRMVYATARQERASLVTRDARLRAFDPGGSVW